jgi:hypothetical protein
VDANLQRLDTAGHLFVMSPVLSSAPDEAAVTDERASGSGLKPYSQVLAPFVCGMFAFIDLYCTQPLLPLLSGVFHASEAKVSLTISASTLGVAF